MKSDRNHIFLGEDGGTWLAVPEAIDRDERDYLARKGHLFAQDYTSRAPVAGTNILDDFRGLPLGRVLQLARIAQINAALRNGADPARSVHLPSLRSWTKELRPFQGDRRAIEAAGLAMAASVRDLFSTDRMHIVRRRVGRVAGNEAYDLSRQLLAARCRPDAKVYLPASENKAQLYGWQLLSPQPGQEQVPSRALVLTTKNGLVAVDYRETTPDHQIFGESTRDILRTGIDPFCLRAHVADFANRRNLTPPKLSL